MSGLLQLAHAVVPRSASEVELFTLEVARLLGGTVLSFAPHSGPLPEAWQGLNLLTPAPGEAALSAWHRALDTVQPQAVFVQHLGALNPTLLLDLRERGIPYAVFLHDFTPLCPTHRLWHRSQERCSGPGRTGFKCAWCVSGTRRRMAELPLRTLLYRHRPQDWRTALLRAEALIAPSRFARDFWIEQGAPPERIAVIPPRLSLGEPPPPPPASGRRRVVFAGGSDAAAGSDLLAGALESLGESIELHAVNHPARQLGDAPPPEPGEGGSRESWPCHGPDTVVAVPARWEIPFSRLVADAQAAGARVVATAIGGLAEQIIHGVNGFLTPADDIASLAEALREAFAPADIAWAGTNLMAAHAQASALAAADSLRRLLDLLLRGATEPDPALELEHGDWLRRLPGGSPYQESVQQLVSALRNSPDTEPVFGDRAFSTTRQRRLDLNRAVAFFRACGCRRLVSFAGPPVPDVVEAFSPWGLDFVAVQALPDGLWLEADSIDASLLRRRFQQAKALVASLPDGLETLNWTDENADSLTKQ
ncbi:MAG: glycosyltransferase [Terriglobales bacterium]